MNIFWGKNRYISVPNCLLKDTCLQIKLNQINKMKTGAVAVLLAIAFLACAVESKHVALQKRQAGGIQLLILSVCGISLNVTDLLLGVIQSVLNTITGLLGSLDVIQCIRDKILPLIFDIIKKCVTEQLALAQKSIDDLCKTVGDIGVTIGSTVGCVTNVDIIGCLLRAVGGLTGNVDGLVAGLLPILTRLLNSLLSCVSSLATTRLSVLIPFIITLPSCLLVL